MDGRALGGVRAAVLALGLVTAFVGGVMALGVVGAPEVVGVENQFGEVTRSTTVIATDVVLHNPNPVGIQLGGTTVNYTVAMNDVHIASGQKDGLTIGRGNTRLHFTTAMDNRKIPEWWVTHVSNGERTTVTVNATSRTTILGTRKFPTVERKTVETNIIGEFNSDQARPVEAPRTLPLTSDPLFYVNHTSAEWGRVTGAETPIDMTFMVYNPQSYPLPIMELGYTVTMNGIRVGAGATQDRHIVSPGAIETVRARTVIINDRLPEWWVTHLRNSQLTVLRINFYALVGLPTGGTLQVPLDVLTYEQPIETDILGNKNDKNGSTAGNTSASASDG